MSLPISVELERKMMDIARRVARDQMIAALRAVLNELENQRQIEKAILFGEHYGSAPGTFGFGVPGKLGKIIFGSPPKEKGGKRRTKR